MSHLKTLHKQKPTSKHIHTLAILYSMSNSDMLKAVRAGEYKHSLIEVMSW